MDSEGAKRLASAISIQAVTDVNATYEKAMRLHKTCYKGGLCDTKKLTDYLVMLSEKKQYAALPFSEEHEYSALAYFSDKNTWGASLLEMAGVSRLPDEFCEKIEALRLVYKKCLPCIAKYRRVAGRHLKSKQEFSAAD